MDREGEYYCSQLRMTMTIFIYNETMEEQNHTICYVRPFERSVSLDGKSGKQSMGEKYPNCFKGTSFSHETCKQGAKAVATEPSLCTRHVYCLRLDPAALDTHLREEPSKGGRSNERLQPPATAASGCSRRRLVCTMEKHSSQLLWAAATGAAAPGLL